MSLSRWGESDEHIKAKDILFEFGTILGYKPEMEYKGFQKELEKIGKPEWRIDVFCPARGDKPALILEADGHVGHHTESDLRKMHVRDTYFWVVHKTRTVRIAVADLVGKKAMDRVAIMAEIIYQIMKYDMFKPAPELQVEKATSQ